MQQVPLVERAFQLARSGLCATTRDIRAALVREQYTGVDMHLAGSLAKQLTLICRESFIKEPIEA